MASINKIKPGQTLYDVKLNTGFGSFRQKYRVWPVLVVSVHPEDGYIIAKWNVVNPESRMYLREISRLRVKEPK